jgi:hypothetical protein
MKRSRGLHALNGESWRTELEEDFASRGSCNLHSGYPHFCVAFLRCCAYEE